MFIRILVILAGLVVIANIAVWLLFRQAHARTPTASDLSLLSAAVEGNAARVETLLSQGANPNVERDGNTPLILCASWEQYDVIRSEEPYVSIVSDLITHGAEPNHRNSSGMTALMYAAGWGHPGTFSVLLDSGADVNMRDDQGRTALTWAGRSLYDRTRFIQPLMNKGAKVGVTEALLMGDLTKARELIDKGGDLSIPDGFGDTPLMIAAEWGSLDCVNALLRRKVDVNACDSEGYTALMISAAGRPRQGLQVARYWHDHGVAKGRGAVIRALVTAGAAVNARSLGYDPITALGLATEAKNRESSAALIALGAKREKQPQTY